jgi:peroxiredoxin
MRDDLVPGNPFPDLRLPDTTGRELALSEIGRGQPLVLAFVRGWWCPKEQVRLRNLVALQDEIQREFGRIAAVTVDEPYVNGAFRAGLGGAFPFLSDANREVAGELDLLELTDETHRPFLPFTFLLDSRLVIFRMWCGFWFWGNPTPDELRLALREIVAAEQPSYDPQAVWRGGGLGAARRRDRRTGRVDPGELPGARALARRPRRARPRGGRRARPLLGRWSALGRPADRGGERSHRDPREQGGRDRRSSPRRPPCDREPPRAVVPGPSAEIV